MSWRSISVQFFYLWLVSTSALGYAQVEASGVSQSPAQAQTLEAAIGSLASQADIIFTGTVAQVRRLDGDGLGAGTVEIRFTVDRPVRGCSAGSYTLREWGGFWNANDSRYRVGQRLLLLLHAPGPAGLSSPVGGMDGAIPLRASGAGVRSSDADNRAPGQLVADLRWIGARLSRPVTYRPSAPALSSSPHTMASSTQPVATSDRSVAAQEASVETLIGILQSPEGARHVAR